MESKSSDSGDFSLELLFRDWLIDSHVFVGSNRYVSIGVELDGLLSENSSLSFLFFISSELRILQYLIPIQMFLLDCHQQLCWLVNIQIEQCKLGRILEQRGWFGWTFDRYWLVSEDINLKLYFIPLHILFYIYSFLFINSNLEYCANLKFINLLYINISNKKNGITKRIPNGCCYSFGNQCPMLVDSLGYRKRKKKIFQ